MQQGAFRSWRPPAPRETAPGHTVRIPATVKPNDRLLLFLTTNTTSRTISDAVPGGSCCSPATATTSGPGLDTSGDSSRRGYRPRGQHQRAVKSAMSVAAYRSTGVPQVSASAVRGVDTTATHPRLADRRGRPGELLAGELLEREVLQHAGLDPARQRHLPRQRASTGSGKVSGILGDSNGPVPSAPPPRARPRPARRRRRRCSPSSSVRASTTGKRAPNAAFTSCCAASPVTSTPAVVRPRRRPAHLLLELRRRAAPAPGSPRRTPTPPPAPARSP